MFGTVLIFTVTCMHVYVVWRCATQPLIRRHIPLRYLIGIGILLWFVFYLGWVVGHGGTGRLAAVIEFSGMTWMATCFLIFLPLLSVDVVTLFGFLMPRLSSRLRSAALLIGVVLSAVSLFQGMRPPVIVNHEVSLPGLPADLDGTVLLALSDLHIGSQLGRRWLAARVEQVQAQRADLVVLLGDTFEGHAEPAASVLAEFGRLSAPLGIWAVPGNHEYHGGGNMRLFETGSMTLLRNRWSEVTPGLVLAEVDDLTARRRRRLEGDPIARAVTGHPPGAVILLSHTPWQAEKAARAGVGMMLSGHTHGGQIWPFGHLVRRRYPLLNGRYLVNGMTVIVSRGTGTWGPRMRLWQPGEILRVTLRSASF